MRGFGFGVSWENISSLHLRNSLKTATISKLSADPKRVEVFPLQIRNVRVDWTPCDKHSHSPCLRSGPKSPSPFRFHFQLASNQSVTAMNSTISQQLLFFLRFVQLGSTVITGFIACFLVWWHDALWQPTPPALVAVICTVLFPITSLISSLPNVP